MIVTGVGQCSWDYLALVDSYPLVDTKKEVSHWEEQGGGPVATALVALSRLGVRCRFYGIIGDDDQGERIRKSLIDESIGVEGLVRRRNASSQLAFIAIEKGTGKRTIFWKSPSGKGLKPEELGRNFLEGSDFLLLDGLMEEVSLYAAEKAKKLNIQVVLDAGRLRKGMVELARRCDYVVASEEFAQDLGWDGDLTTLRRGIGRLGARVVTITLGSVGSITFINDEIIKVPAFAVEVVDTTGAGDAFHGGYIYGLLRRWNLPDVIRFATALAAIKCRRVGGRSGLPDPDEVLRFLSPPESSL